jgi:hypothetical protein
VERAAMQARHQPFDDDPRDQLEVGDPRKHFRRARGWLIGGHKLTSESEI